MESLKCLSNECTDLLHKNNLLRPLIKAELIKNTMLNVQVSDNIKDELIEQFKKDLGTTDTQVYKKWLEERKIEETQLLNSEIEKIKLRKYCHLNFGHKVQSRFLERKNDLDIVVYSMIRLSDAFLAREIYYRIEAGEEDIGDLASQYSEGIEKRTRGIVGPVPLGQSHPVLVEKLKAIEPGVVQQPIHIANSHIIIKLESYEPAQLDKFMREKMGEELFNQWLESQIEKLTLTLINQDKQNKSNGNIL